jgi:hypothetical protein
VNARACPSHHPTICRVQSVMSAQVLPWAAIAPLTARRGPISPALLTLSTLHTPSGVRKRFPSFGYEVAGKTMGGWIAARSHMPPYGHGVLARRTRTREQVMLSGGRFKVSKYPGEIV